MDGYPAMSGGRRDKAREGFRARLVTLPDAGWQRVE